MIESCVKFSVMTVISALNIMPMPPPAITVMVSHILCNDTHHHFVVMMLITVLDHHTLFRPRHMWAVLPLSQTT
jgi:hypothetical protein